MLPSPLMGLSTLSGGQSMANWVMAHMSELLFAVHCHQHDIRHMMCVSYAVLSPTFPLKDGTQQLHICVCYMVDTHDKAAVCTAYADESCIV